MKKAPREQGFTLIEIIVVIVLFSLITTLSIQGIGYVLGQRARMAQFQQEMVASTLRHQWFVEAIEGLAIPPEDRGYRFIGNARELYGFSSSPLINPDRPGVYISLSLSAEGGLNALNYYQFGSASGNKTPLSVIPVLKGVNGDAYFRYLDENGAFHDQWPPANRPVGESRFNTLPEAIAVYMGVGYPVSWMARIKNAKNVKAIERFTE